MRPQAYHRAEFLMRTAPCPLGHIALVAAAALSLAACSAADPPDQVTSGDQGGAGAGPGRGGGGGEGGDVGEVTTCVDDCPASSAGIKVGCKTRFMYGMNYAWHHFAGDFGGIAAWDQGGVAAESHTHREKLADMRAHGASVVRWWMMPEFRGEGVVFDASDTPVGLGEETQGDLEKALELAEQADVHLMLCLFSFDAFRQTRVESGVRIVGIRPIVTEAEKRAKLMDNVLRPLARAVEKSPYRHRMVAWDVINEPEWAIAGQSPYGDPEYTPTDGLETVTHEQMETFVSDAIRTLRSESSALITIGGAAMKWSRAWKRTDIDFYTFHIYDWVNVYWPYNQSPADYRIDDRPVVMGEFPIAGLSTASVSTLLESWYSQGYAGAISWAYGDATATELETMKAFADSKGCDVQY